MAMLNTTALLLALSAPVQDGAVELVWNPTSEPVRHQWVTAHQLFVDSITRTVEETVIPMNMRFSLKTERRVTAVDKVLEIQGNKATRLQREFEVAEMSARMEPVGEQDVPMPTSDFVMTSELAGKAVVWTWVPQEGAYGRYYSAAEGREDALPALREDMSLRSLLPSGPVKVGGSWDIDPLSVVDVFEPGGQLSFSSTRGSRLLKRNISSGVGGGLHHLFGGQAAGSIQARLESLEGGVAVIKIRLNRLRYLVNHGAFLAEHTLGREEQSGMKILGGQLIVDINGEATLAWSVDSGRPTAFSMKADQEVEMSFETVHSNGKKMVERMRMVGGLVGTYSASPGAPR